MRRKDRRSQGQVRVADDELDDKLDEALEDCCKEIADIVEEVEKLENEIDDKLEKANEEGKDSNYRPPKQLMSCVWPAPPSSPWTLASRTPIGGVETPPVDVERRT